MKKITKISRFNENRRRSSAGMFNTSSAGAVTSLILVVAFSLVGASAPSVYADDPVPSLTINVDNGSGGTDLTMDMLLNSTDGTFKSSGDLNISVSTTNIIGYTLGIVADGTISGNSSSSSAALINTTDASKKVPSITGLVSATDFSAAGSTGSTYNNKWGYKPSKFNSSDNTTNYYPAPNTVGDTLDVTAVSSELPNTYTISFGTRIDGGVTPGSYSNTFIITAVANFAQYGINYYAGSGSSDASLAHMPINETGYIVDEKLPISQHIPTRDSYGFIGWCLGTSSESNITTNNGVDSCSSTVYQAGKRMDVDVTQYSDTTYYLYAMWSNGLYDKVSSLVKRDDGVPRTQSLADMQAVITEPTSSEPLYDTSNSGVYAYDAATFGTASDADNNYPIYYYRGWLDRTFAASDGYGGVPSTGDSGYYPNYVRLSDIAGGKSSTCWRIVRTTGSGGIKMIYNGEWDSVNNTCAHSRGNVAINSITYDYWNRGTDNSGEDIFGTKGFVTYVGYNYNSTYAYNNTSATSAVLNSTLFNNESPSNARNQIENWYVDTSNLPNYAYNDKLEISAGWCDDRTTTGSPSASDTSIPYSVSKLDFGAQRRNVGGAGKLSLTCLNVTGNDLLTTANGLSAPLALLTADEAALVGNGIYHYYDTPETGPETDSRRSSNYSYSSYLRSGSNFWLLSPYYNYYTGSHVFSVRVRGYIDAPPSAALDGSFRPVISLVHASRIDSGSGTVTDPWVIDASADTDYTRTMQNVNEWGSSIPVGGEVTTTDTRDGNQYTVARLCTNYASGNNCTESQLWMTQNLDLDIGGSDGHGGTMVLDSTNTDINADLGSSAGYSTDNNTGVITWAPSATKATISSWDQGNNEGAVPDWRGNNVNPYQAEGDNHYVYNGTIYDSLNLCEADNHTEAECNHYKVGNYYNWSAAIASNDSSNYTTQYDVADNSICPKGWRLPRWLTNVNDTVFQSEFNKLLFAQGVVAGVDITGDRNIGYISGGSSRINTIGIRGDPLYFVRSGHILNKALRMIGENGNGFYWSSNRNGDMNFSLLNVWPAGINAGEYGASIRCVSGY